VVALVDEGVLEVVEDVEDVPELAVLGADPPESPVGRLGVYVYAPGSGSEPLPIDDTLMAPPCVLCIGDSHGGP
ncbi:MAG: hypothetical protein ABR975_09370, partial [Vulcanimicrobiaceae bacterium]|jgi:hypothetical protein